MSGENISIKKEHEGEIFNLYEESSGDDSIIQVMRRKKKNAQKAAASSRRAQATQVHKRPAAVDPEPSSIDGSMDEPPPRTTTYKNPTFNGQAGPKTALNDDLFEVFTNPEKKRMNMEESDQDENEYDQPDDFNPHDHGHHQPAGYNQYGDDAGGGYDDDDEPSERPSPGFNTIEEEKQDYLYKFYRLQSKGVPITKKFNMNSNVAEMRSEFSKIKRDSDVNASIMFSRQMLMGCVTGIEILNRRYDPFDIKLDGWSGSIMTSMDNYDNVFERLHDKYASRIAMAPELELMLTLAGSAFMFHLTNSMFRGMPNLNDIAKQNPDILKSMMQTMSAAASTNAQPAHKKTPDSSSANKTPDGDGHREMAPPMFDMSSLLGMLGGMGGPSFNNEPPPQTKHFAPVGNYPVASRTLDFGNKNTSATVLNKQPRQRSPTVDMFTSGMASPSVVSSSSDGEDSDNHKSNNNNHAKTISFSETTTMGGTKSKRNRRNKIQSTSANTISI